MSTFGLDFPGLTPGRLLSWLRARRKALAGRSATLQWSVVALAVGGLSLAGYLAASALAPEGPTYLGSGRRYSSDDLLKITRELDKQRIRYTLLDDHRIVVAADAFDAAGAAVAKLEVGPRPLEDIRDAVGQASIFESPHDKEVREQRDKARVFERLIDDLPGVESSFVLINRSKQRVGLRLVDRPSALVRLETDGGRELPFSVVESITSILTVSENGLTPQAITVMDRSGHRYLDAGNPELNAHSTTRAREENLSRRILEKLDWIPGVSVDVQLAIAEPEDQPEPTSVETRPTAPPTPIEPGISVSLNQALSIDLEPAEPAPSAPSPAPPAVEPTRRGQVWVRVPRSYYLNAGFTPDRHEPSQDDIRTLMARTESQIRKAVELVIPEIGTAAWQPPSIDVIADQTPDDLMPAVISGRDSRRVVNEWATAGAAGAAAAALVAVGTWVFGSRQPTRRAAASRGSLRYHRGSPATPPPTERVLEFVRRNPEAAFSVLNRWTSQGGGPS